MAPKSHRARKQYIEDCLHKYEGPLLRYTSKWLPENQAREVVQEVFLKLWEEISKENSHEVPPWLYVVCRHRAIDILRREGRMSSLSQDQEADLESADFGVDEKLAKEQSHNQLFSIVKELAKTEQEVVLLKFQEDLSYQEISQITGHTVSHVGVLIHRAMKKLRKELGGRHESA